MRKEVKFIILLEWKAFKYYIIFFLRGRVKFTQREKGLNNQVFTWRPSTIDDIVNIFLLQ